MTGNTDSRAVELNTPRFAALSKLLMLTPLLRTSWPTLLSLLAVLPRATTLLSAARKT